MLSVVGFSLECVGEVNEDVTLLEDFSCPDTDLVLNAGFSAGEFAVSINSLFVNDSGSYSGSGELTLDGANSDGYCLNTIGDFASSVINFKCSGKVNSTLSGFNFYLGSLEFENGETLYVSSDDLPISGEIPVVQVAGTYTGGFKLYGEGDKLISYKDAWEVSDKIPTDNYFDIVLDGETWFVVTQGGVDKALTDPVITLETPSDQINKNTVDFVYSVESNSTLTKCELYIDDILNETVDNPIEFKITKDIADSKSDKSYYWNVTCIDVWGNSSFSGQKSFVMKNDTTNPLISFIREPSKAEILMNEEILLNCTATDNVDVTYVRIYTESDTVCSGGEQGCSKKMSWASEGEIIFYCEAKDSNGNRESIQMNQKIVKQSSETIITSSSNEDKKEEKKEEKKEDSLTGMVIAGDEESVFSIDEEDVPVREIIITTENLTVEVEVSAAELGDLPDPERDVYSYMEITADVSEEDIIEAKIKFIVPISWLNENKLDKGDIVLLRYNGGWEELSTIVIEEKDEYIEFEASCRGFSVFAVGTRSKMDFGLALILVGIGVVLVIVYGIFMKLKKKSLVRKYKAPEKKKYKYDGRGGFA